MSKSCQKLIASEKIYDIIRIIPKGQKITLWFTYENYPILYSFPNYVMNPDKKIDKNTRKYNASFDPILSSGTICYGSLLHYKNKHFFFMENVMMFQGIYLSKHTTWCKRFEYMISILNHIRHDFFKTGIKTLRIGLPISLTTASGLKRFTETVYYPIYSVEYLKGTHKHVERIQNKISYKNFMIKADIKDDIYHLYNEEYVGTALIPNLETSKMMNSIFRNIKENKNLDLLEESDDDEDFENIDENKYVHLDTIYRFRCVLHDRFQLWMPIERIQE